MTSSPKPGPLPASDNETAPPKVTLIEALKTIQIQDFAHVHETPCARPAFLYGIGSGFLLSGVQLILGASIRKASSWGVGGFIGVSALVYEGCSRQRAKEKERIRIIQETLDQKAREKERVRQLYLEERAKREAAAAAQVKPVEQKQNSRNWTSWFWR